MFSELDLCYCTLSVFSSVFSTPSLTVLSYCMLATFQIVYYWTTKDGWMVGNTFNLEFPVWLSLNPEGVASAPVDW